MSTTFVPRFDEEDREGRRVILGPDEQEYYSSFSRPAQQVPMEYYEKPYPLEPDYSRAEDMETSAVCGCMPPLAVGYFVCLFTLLEGIVLLLHVTQVVEPSRGLFTGLYDGHNPFATTEKLLLWLVSFLDIAAFIGGVLGLYLSVHVAPDSVRRRMSKGLAGSLPTRLLSAVLIWRIVVTFGTAPFVGVMLAFAAPDTDRTPYIVGAMSFIFVNIVFVYGLAQVFRAAAVESEYVAERAEVMNLDERRNFLHSAYRNQLELVEKEPRLFGCIPLELALGLWTLSLTVACVVAFIEVCAAGVTVGGWAYFVMIPDVHMIRWLEFVTYFLGAVAALAALVGIISHHSARSQEAETLASPPGSEEYYEDLDQAIKAKKRSTFAILMFFVASLFRISCFIPITGMALVAKDVCGIYTTRLSMLPLSAGSRTPLHCETSDAGVFLLVAATAALDFYLLWGVFKLWQAYRGASFAVKDSPSAYYGAAGYPQKEVYVLQ